MAMMLLALAAARDDPLAGRVAGAPVNCIDLDRIGGPEIVDARVILYRDGRRVWRTEPIGGCPGLRSTDTLQVELYGRQVCRNDRFRSRSTGSLPGRYCRFGSFTPYDKAP